MFLRNTLTKVCLGLIIALGCAGVALAQQPGQGQQQDSAPNRMQREGRRGARGERREHMMGLMRALRELELTEAQRQQARTIIERAVENTRPQREALQQLREQYKQGATAEETGERAMKLRAEIRESMKSAHDEIVTLLTPEQRAKLEQMEKERKARHEEKRGLRRGEREQ